MFPDPTFMHRLALVVYQERLQQAERDRPQALATPGAGRRWTAALLAPRRLLRQLALLIGQYGG